jgi:hypothetical protein
MVAIGCRPPPFPASSQSTSFASSPSIAEQEKGGSWRSGQAKRRRLSVKALREGGRYGQETEEQREEEACEDIALTPALFTRQAEAVRVTSIMAQMVLPMSLAGESHLPPCAVAEPSVHGIEARPLLKSPLAQQLETEVFHTQWLMIRLRVRAAFPPYEVFGSAVRRAQVAVYRLHDGNVIAKPG